LSKICNTQINEFVWKCPKTSDNDEEKFLKFRTMNDSGHHTTLSWYLKSINEIDVITMDPWTQMHQIEFKVKINQKIISLTRLYPTYPKVSGFEILQFVSNLAYQCKFAIDVEDIADVSIAYSSLYGKGYYESFFKGLRFESKFFI